MLQNIVVTCMGWEVCHHQTTRHAGLPVSGNT